MLCYTLPRMTQVTQPQARPVFLEMTNSARFVDRLVYPKTRPPDLFRLTLAKTMASRLIFVKLWRHDNQLWFLLMRAPQPLIWFAASSGKALAIHAELR